MDLRGTLLLISGILVFYHLLRLLLTRNSDGNRSFSVGGLLIFLLSAALCVGFFFQVCAPHTGFEGAMTVTGPEPSQHEFWFTLPMGPYSAAVVCYPEPEQAASDAESESVQFHLDFTILKNEQIVATGSGLRTASLSAPTHHGLGTNLTTLDILDFRKLIHVVIRIDPLEKELPPMTFVIQTTDELKDKRQGASLRSKSYYGWQMGLGLME